MLDETQQTAQRAAGELARAKSDYFFSISTMPADCKFAEHVRTIGKAIDGVLKAKIDPTSLPPECLQTLKLVCDLMDGWHSRVKTPVAVRVKARLDGYDTELEVVGAEGERNVYEYVDGRWKGGGWVSLMDVAIDSGLPLAFFSGLEKGIQSAFQALTKSGYGRKPEYIDLNGAVNILGLPKELIEGWVKAEVVPHYSFPGYEGVWFSERELKNWAKSLAKAHGGKVPDKKTEIKITSPKSGQWYAIPECLKGMQDLREIDLFSKKCGIYFLCRGAEVVYVGQSIAVGGRIASHVTEGRKQFDRAFFVPCEPDNLNEFERELIDIFDPEYNSDSLTKSRRRTRECEPAV